MTGKKHLVYNVRGWGLSLILLLGLLLSLHSMLLFNSVGIEWGKTVDQATMNKAYCMFRDGI